jgi:hypothetical protein
VTLASIDASGLVDRIYTTLATKKLTHVGPLDAALMDR